jgi:hypothetical protein
MKKLVVLLLAAVTAAVAASSATPYLASEPMSGRHDLLQCIKTWTVNNTTVNGVLGDGDPANPYYGAGAPLTDPRMVAPSPNPPDPLQANPPGQVRGGTISSTDSIYLSIGWATNTKAQLQGFLGVPPQKPNQYGTITIHPGSAAATPIKTVAWTSGNYDYWIAPKQIHNPGLTGGQSTVYLSRLYAPIGQLGTGTYYVDADLELSKPSYDGDKTYQSGPWFKVTGCKMVVG